MSCRIGLQLYSLREPFERDWSGTLARVAAMDCDGVELAAKPNASPAQFAQFLIDLGLEACSMHVGLEALLDDAALDHEHDWVDALGCDLLVVPWVEPPTTGDAARRIAADLAQAGHRVGERGLRLAYHNHDFEFSTRDDGRSLWQHILAIDPGTLLLELDVGWLWHAGLDPVAELVRVGDRCPVLHIKDFAGRPGKQFCPVGTGSAPLAQVVASVKRISDSTPDCWLIAEQDEFLNGLDPFDAMATSCAAIRRWLR